MTKLDFYGAGFPYLQFKDLPGKLIVLEGTDGVGRSTQIQLLRQWLEAEGFAVSNTGLRRSPLTQPGLDAAKLGHTLSPLTMSLFYATDFADRLERQIIPALKAGFIVLSDRYFYSIIARDSIRGLNPHRLRKVYGFALKPDIILYLKADITTLVSRIVHGRGFDFWEAGMDIRCADNLYDSFCAYQTLLIQEFDRMVKEFGFITIDANQNVQSVFADLRTHIKNLFVPKSSS
ncbi:MAG: thymidylate kinase [Anaerolineae bacterium]|nr:thymidylate kinase [Anaerolineae bacterium]